MAENGKVLVFVLAASLYQSIRALPTFKTFKSSLKNHLLSYYNS